MTLRPGPALVLLLMTAASAAMIATTAMLAATARAQAPIPTPVLATPSANSTDPFPSVMPTPSSVPVAEPTPTPPIPTPTPVSPVSELDPATGRPKLTAEELAELPSASPLAVSGSPRSRERRWPFGRLINAHLRDQLEGDPDRILPRSDLFVAAIDGHLFQREAATIAQTGYYHSGYWIAAFGELRKGDRFTLNTKLIFANPATSYGITSASFIHPFVGASWVDNLSNYGGFDLGVQARFFDLDRQTLGSGLTIDEKEMSGILIDVDKGGFRFRKLFNGTGGYDLYGDLNYHQLDYGRDLLGVYAYTIRSVLASGDRDPYFYGVYSKHPIAAGFSYALEGSQRNGMRAYLAGAGHDGSWFGGMVETSARYQFRAYARGYAVNVRGAVVQDYVSIEQEDKAFNNSMNIFVVGDDVTTHGGKIDILIRPHKWIRLFTQDEVVWFNYRSSAAAPRRLHYVRHGAGFCPTGTEDCLYLIYSNKTLSPRTTPIENDVVNGFLFRQAWYMGTEARFRF